MKLLFLLLAALLGIIPAQAQLLHGVHHAINAAGPSYPGWILVADGVPASLDINCLTNQTYQSGTVSTPGAILTVSRSTSAYIFDSLGNYTSVAANTLRRSDLGCLIEPASTNLFLHSNAPATQTITVTNSTVYTVSLVASAGTLTLSGAGTGTVTPGNPRTITTTSTSLTVTVSGVSGTFTNVNVEQQAWASSPIVTGASSATRAADYVHIASTITASATIYAQGTFSPRTLPSNSNAFAMQGDGATLANRFGFQDTVGAATINVLIQTAGVLVANNSMGNQIAGRNKMAAAATANSQAASLNGAAVVTTTGTQGAPTASNILELGTQGGGGSNWLQGFVERVAIWPNNRISNAGLQSLTATPLASSGLFHFDGTNGSTSFPDSSGNGAVFTIQTPPVTISTTQSKFGGASAFYNGAGAQLNTSGGTVPFTFGTGDFTIDLWYWSLSEAIQANLFTWSANNAAVSTVLVVDTTGEIYLYQGGLKIGSPTGLLTTNIWHHLAVTRQSGSTRMFFDGVQQGSTWADSTNYNDPTFELGYNNAGYAVDGYIDELRIIVGTAAWTANFTPPSAPYNQ